MRLSRFLILLFLLLQLNLNAQEKQKPASYIKPVNMPVFLSGTFAELRPDHFHSGIDIRVGGVEGAAVLAVEDGFVSRVAVSPGGFGKVVYLDHPSTGHTSVYAHLQRFAPKLNAWVKKQQYAQEKFTVNLLPEKTLFPVKKGEVIGYAGNSGSSGGPHLHFEIRDAASQEVLNPMKNGFAIKDFVRPAITRLAVYPEGDESEVEGRHKPAFFEVQGWGLQHRIKDRKIIKAAGSVSFGINTHDTQNDSPNINGVFSIELFVESERVFSWKADRFSFDETRYINSFIDYAFLYDKNSRIMRTVIDPANKLGMYEGVVANGKITVNPGDTLNVVYVVKDANDNESRIPFLIVGTGLSGKALNAKNADSTFIQLNTGKRFQYTGHGFEVDFPADALYKDEKLQLKNNKGEAGHLSDIITVGSPDVAVHKNYRLTIKAGNNKIPTQKLGIVMLDKGKKTFVGGEYKDGFITVSTRKLGQFAVMSDSVKPTLQPVNFKNQQKVDSLKSLKITVKDDFSGIADIQPTLNGNWLLMDYDPKNNLLEYEIDERLISGKNTFKLVVKDNCGNKTTYEAVIHR
ncbi:MAG TPA: M23 family metallopeptidase [Bacteroidales bacterium]|nr:M23 family metallopeptidase [Bacteroidales bacterium]